MSLSSMLTALTARVGDEVKGLKTDMAALTGVANETPTVKLLSQERGRRLGLGVEVSVSNGQGSRTFASSRPGHVPCFHETVAFALTLTSQNQGSTVVSLPTATGLVQVPASEVVSIGSQVGLARHKIWKGFFTLMAMDTLPDDYTADTYWS